MGRRRLHDLPGSARRLRFGLRNRLAPLLRLQAQARMFHDRRNPDGTGWAVLADPEGNELCVLRSAAERASTG